METGQSEILCGQKDYPMTPENLKKYKTVFESERDGALYNSRLVNETFVLPTEELKDEVDMTSVELETGMRMRLRNRENLYLKKIDEALKRIQDGSFGDCADCGEEIEPRRLEARPTTTCCISCKEAEEMRERSHIDGHRSKSLGHTGMRRLG